MTGLRHELLDALGVRHGFGTRSSVTPAAVARPRQVHGRVVARFADRVVDPPDADAVWTDDPDCPVGVVTADCVPILAAAADGRAVVAIHAGWRGLSAGVVADGIERLREACGQPVSAVVGPHIGACCYEVDAPVTGPLRDRFGGDLEPALQETRPGHWRLDLAALVETDLARAGLEPSSRGRVPGCTACDRDRFHSYRRDGQAAGRLLHWIQPSGPVRSATGEGDC